MYGPDNIINYSHIGVLCEYDEVLMRLLRHFFFSMVTSCTTLPSLEKILDADQDGYDFEEDCDDDDPDANPDAVEIWYDGIDGNCGGDDDYDQDKDGFVPDVFYGLFTYSAGEVVIGTGELPGGDEDDTNPLINPNGEDEEPID